MNDNNTQYYAKSKREDGSQELLRDHLAKVGEMAGVFGEQIGSRKTAELCGKLHDFGKYLTAMLELDAFFLNEDRHTNNIAVLYDTEKDCYELSPIFDQGLSLLADTSYDFSLEQPLEDCIKRVEAKPFHSSFVQQVDAAEELYGIQIHFHFGAKEVQKELQTLNEGYSEEIIMRVERLLREQMRRYAYLMD